jgi:glycosyltransferase involved in cell wall biosynthesis
VHRRLATFDGGTLQMIYTSGPRRRILFLAENFRQGWGGAPESIRLMARRLSDLGVSSDVVDRGRVHRAIETLAVLPEGCSDTEPFSLLSVARYDALLQVGPWQNPLRVWKIVSSRRPSTPYYYLPRGGLARIEFEGVRGIKKAPYFLAIEANFIQAADAIVFSSEIERNAMTRLYSGRSPEFIIPDYFEAPEALASMREQVDGLRISFLAEIAPRKGLLPLMCAVERWAARRTGWGATVRLSVGGGVRAGAERYFRRVRDVSAGIAQVQVEYLGPVSHADRPSFYAGTDLFVVPSLFESFGLTILEATSAGCALLCSSHVGALEYFPESPRVMRFDSTHSLCVDASLDNAFITATEPSGRRRSIEVAADAVAGINALADSEWSRLLELGHEIAVRA